MISVIIPTFNRSELLPRSVGSILKQTYGDWELIIVDDGSTDNTKEVVENLGRHDARVRYLQEPHSGSPPKVRNAGIRETKGDYIAFLDSDDEWLPEKLEKQLNAITTSPERTAFVSCDSIIRSRKGDFVYRNPRNRNHSDQILWGPFISIGSTMLIKSSVIKQFGGFDETMGLVEDWDLPLTILNAGYDAVLVHEPLAICYVHQTNITHIDLTNAASFSSRQKYLGLFLEKHKEIFSKNEKPFSFHMLRLGTFEFLSGERKKALRHFIGSAKANPISLRPYALIVISLLGSKVFRWVLWLVKKVRPDSLSKMLKYY